MYPSYLPIFKGSGGKKRCCTSAPSSWMWLWLYLLLCSCSPNILLFFPLLFLQLPYESLVSEWLEIYPPRPQPGVKVVKNVPSLQFPWLPLCQILSFFFFSCIFSNLQLSVVFLECLVNCECFYPLTDVAGSCQRNKKAGSW